MSQEAPRAEMTRKPILYRIPEMDAVTIRKDIPYRDAAAGPLTFDLYLPPALSPGARVPVVIFVSGYTDPALQAFLGCRLKEWESYVTWARLIAASGMAAITYTTREPISDF